MLSYCLKCRKNIESKSPNSIKTREYCFYQNVQCVTIKNQNLFKSNKLYVIIVSRMSFRVNPHSIVGLNIKELLARSRHHV